MSKWLEEFYLYFHILLQQNIKTNADYWKATFVKICNCDTNKLSVKQKTELDIHS